MNKARRKEIEALSDMLLNISEQLEDIKNDEEESYENMFEWIDAYQNSEEAQENLDEAISSIEDARGCLEKIINQ